MRAGRTVWYNFTYRRNINNTQPAGRIMDEIFRKFEVWYLNKKVSWEQKGVVVDKAGLGRYGHQYCIKLHSENGLGNIILYESNGYYWVDFEGGNYDCDIMFMRAGIEFEDVQEMDVHEREFIEHITWKKEIL